MKVIRQFAYKHTSPELLEGRNVCDCRVLRNPWKPGVPDAQLIETVRRDTEGYDELVGEAFASLRDHDEILVGCQHGHHRSGAVVLGLTELLEAYGDTYVVYQGVK